MIVLDENLLGLRLNNPIVVWYPGRVCYVTDLRPGTVIKDEAILQCLQQLKGATFVTTNVVDFWRRALAHARYSIVCLSLSNERLREVPELLRRALALAGVHHQGGPNGKGGAGRSTADPILCGW